MRFVFLCRQGRLRPDVLKGIEVPSGIFKSIQVQNMPKMGLGPKMLLKVLLASKYILKSGSWALLKILLLVFNLSDEGGGNHYIYSLMAHMRPGPLPTGQGHRVCIVS